MLKLRVRDKILFSEDGYFLLKLEKLTDIAVKPGQFFEIRVREDFEPFLSRPFSVFFSSGEEIWFLIKIVGKGTRILSELKNGDTLSLLGPLGNGFPEVESPVLVAGGSGIAPLYFYATLRGFKSFSWGLPSLPSKEFLRLFEGLNIEIFTEDGSSGKKGLVTEGLKIGEGDILFACGPIPMIKALKEKVPHEQSFVSMESVMACGFGICFGCAIKKRNAPGYFRVCKDGPVFRLSDIDI
ncbi:MAG: dihydroorotate dehydrogenase electron transfer subunit [Candidatus Hydrothermia bacterium]